TSVFLYNLIISEATFVVISLIAFSVAFKTEYFSTPTTLLRTNELMEFRLTYQGPLPSNGTVQVKHSIRKQLHSQIKELWNYIPLLEHREYLNFPPKEISVVRRVAGFDFAVLVCQALCLHAEIDITLLRPGPIGGLITRGGDIDNQLKTLFDALRYPKESKELPNGISPSSDEIPFFCLLEDDNLITKIFVSVDRLLMAPNIKDVFLLAHVKVKATRIIYGNMGLIT
ncbi:MAG: hypothetical protein QME52_02395, partial [Bacteroidota bacterium]|nr:hypothetical protein [Bacteroidota bacterium]